MADVLPSRYRSTRYQTTPAFRFTALLLLASTISVSVFVIPYVASTANEALWNQVAFVALALATGWNLYQTNKKTGLAPISAGGSVSLVETHTCQSCNRVKSALTAHCALCGSCIRKRRHHCHFTASCVNADNVMDFMRFVLFAFLVATFASVTTSKLMLQRGVIDGWSVRTVVLSLAPLFDWLHGSPDLTLVDLWLSTLLRLWVCIAAYGCVHFITEVVLMARGMTRSEWWGTRGVPVQHSAQGAWHNLRTALGNRNPILILLPCDGLRSASREQAQ